LIPIGFGCGDGDGFFLRGWVWDSETRPRLAPLPYVDKYDLTARVDPWPA